MYDFEYQRATSLADAAVKLQAADDGKLMAGGMTLIPTLKQRLASPTHVIDLARIADLAGITVSGDTVAIGAMTTHATVADSRDVAKAIPALAALAGDIGDPAVRQRGTIGGSICNNDPSADYPAGLLGLGATVHTDRRTISAEDFFVDLFETALEPDEIVTKVSFPIPEKACYMKFPNPASRYAVVGVFVAKSGGSVRVAVTGAGPCAFRVEAMERALAADFRPEAIEGIAVPADGFNADIHASAEYRAHLVGVMARRAVAGCG